MLRFLRYHGRKLGLVGLLLVKRLPYIFITALCLYGLAYLAQMSYYRWGNPNWFVTVRSATVDSSQVNLPLKVTFCRNSRENYDNAMLRRSFFRVDGESRFNAGTYTAQIDLERGDTCQIINVPVDKHPNDRGIYTAQSAVRFNVRFDDYSFSKVVEYDLDKPFELRDTVEGLQEQIRTLQAEIEVLREILRSRGVEVPENAPVTQLRQTVNNTSSQATVPSTTSSNPPTTPVVGTAPPDPDTPARPQPAAQVDTGLVQLQVLPSGQILCLNTALTPGVCL